MNRRNFIRNSAMAGVSATALTTAACKTDRQSASIPDNETNAFADDFVLNEISVDELQKLMESGQYTSVAITQLYLDRIQAVDQKGPHLRSVIEVNPDALTMATTLDQERKAGKVRGPLHGIPILIKDNIDTGDAMMTTAGALALNGHRAAKDAFVVTKLREAGVVILGKTNLSEWANFRSTRSSSGWSSRGGQTRNPYVLDRSPSGSSSGSGAAVAANLCAVAVGTETDGSVIAPSSFCGLVGLKPTVGLVSRTGIIPISKTQDTAGPMARTVTDAALVLGAMAGADPTDAVTNESAGKVPKTFTTYLTTSSLAGKRIGMEASFLNGQEGVVGLYKDAIEVLKKQGATVVEVELLKSLSDRGGAEFTVLQYEFKEGVNHYLSTASAGVKTLSEVIAFNRKNAATAMPFFKQETLESSDAKAGLDSKEYTDALAKTRRSRARIDELMAANKLDAICGVSIGFAGCIDLVNGDYDTGFYFCPPAAMAGYPHITVPMGMVQGLPVGFSLMARAWQEGPLLGMAYAYEQASKKRVPPRFIKSLVPA
ncbi:amidase [Fibrella forsythiae]|uniref:Amidase n=1 Tax=Fibrella forsythiae TaxID=2817061 RepID=A0ABS3JGL5_9BACT|nr:amidase [Fibrella forsythiae]MBO0949146.1 amidase [Fibrella forsythiae]